MPAAHSGACQNPLEAFLCSNAYIRAALTPTWPLLDEAFLIFSASFPPQLQPVIRTKPGSIEPNDRDASLEVYEGES